jgi:hypothetical protein
MRNRAESTCWSGISYQALDGASLIKVLGKSLEETKALLLLEN